ncbi:MAG: hypothetical protein CO186_10915 [Zetaproteobacteria bacterium CG_4_9_14_3_um_filter_49_83]|nr:MAG: hypothetical protein AUJ56_09305 [Zetaproteobacteria bacterium CG1_02_49_23]PIQ33319.1 MAG: hypothetical protein COW62_05620 [Zetaproteobacteria bacterium CG17_big_fil_post_rev_8_21_14_2_50_50_13]PIV29026.1 MAG: hypothetical protein COS35_14230 [Zetaproteobacteria bacterium CG02_land_8_20_14_3_00_50_9]PIY57055.1 MAG: hypothetical protein COZ00_00800 [Zetaproteobacteria bacterium CG_4_10_14_0_8_um_filter_49_80]PJA34405.1 MAG: hypothetical protein CO186_10915 [Zetaproteobacteria bacterium
MSPDEMKHDLRDERLSKLYRQSAREEPAMRLDSAVLSQARKAVEKAEPWCKISWLAPLATVGVAMLTVSLVIQMQQQHPEIVAPASMEKSVPVFQTSPVQKSAPDLRSAPKSDGLMHDELRLQEPVKRLEMKPAAPVMDRAAPVNEMKVAPLHKATEAAKKQEAMGQSRMMEKDAEAASTVPTAAVPSAVQGLSEQEMHGELSGFSKAKEQNEKADVKKPQLMQEMQRMKEVEVASEPEQWIENIRALLEQGKQAEALKEIVAFKAAYPDYELPADLVEPQ